ncbi:uncharacterized protein LOC62_06G008801 [Vanrija pseudolonga]|uniref:Uncharacterized protein n=1 Tax=Vanrija pseudolonga TaxID=143232 RepID=A0AAF0YEK8_9TREE|nr:hypothetical protein LOC62_06G008801 [Vanrija pseudolonga]
MGCTSSTPLKDAPSAHQVAQPAMAQPATAQRAASHQATGPQPTTGVSNTTLPDDIKDAIKRADAEKSAFMAAMVNALPDILHEPSMWCLSLDIALVIIYLVDDGVAGPEVLVVFQRKNGSFATSEALASLQPAGSEAYLVNKVKGEWTKLCESNGALGTNRPARLILSYRPNFAGPGALPQNLTATFAMPPAHIGMPAVTGAAGMAEWLRTLQTSGLEAASNYRRKFSNGPGPGEVTTVLTVPFRLNAPAPGQEHLASSSVVTRAAPVLSFQRALIAMLPSFARSIWLSASLAPGDGRNVPDDDKVDITDLLGPFVALFRGKCGVDDPIRVVFKYAPKTAQAAERVEVDLAWMPRETRDPSKEDTMARWVTLLETNNEEAARWGIHSTDTTDSDIGDISLVGDPATLDVLACKWSPAFKAWVAGSDQAFPTTTATAATYVKVGAQA